MARHLLKQIHAFGRLPHQKDCWGTAKVNGVFNVLPWQLYYWWLYSWNSNDVSSHFPICSPDLTFECPSASP